MLKTYMFTDGSCGGKGFDMGAWCAVVVTPHRRKLLYGTLYPTTVNRCELTPMIAGLAWIRSNMNLCVPVCIYTDSEHTAQAVAGLFTPEENRDLWASFREITRDMTVVCHWRERNSHPYMELCDALASTLRKGQIEISTRLFDNWKEPEAGLPEVMLPQIENYNIMDGIQAAANIRN